MDDSTYVIYISDNGQFPAHIRCSKDSTIDPDDGSTDTPIEVEDLPKVVEGLIKRLQEVNDAKDN